MKKKEFLKLEKECGFNFAVKELAREERSIMDLYFVKCEIANEIARELQIPLGNIDWVKEVIDEFVENGNKYYWLYDKRTPTAIKSIEDIEYLLDD